MKVIWRARVIVGCLALVALCFHQAPGKIVPDTKLDLTAGPGAFLGRALHLWDPQGAFGQLQNQAYGYLLPMGPFHWLLDTLSVPGWIVQRLWWSVVLCVAFVGVWKLCNALQYGVPWTRFAAALLYAASPRMLGELSITSIEVWPMAMAPWVLLPLVTPTGRSTWWRVSWSAVAFALVGGVNAVATGATLVLPALWLITRRGTIKATAAWLGCVAAVSLWWLVPLVLLGRYSPPFLDWIEDAAVTTGMASVFESFRGTSQWLNFLSGGGGPSWPAGWLYVTQPTLILVSAAIALVGLLGLGMSSLRHRGFLQLSFVVGLLLLTLGHAGAAGSPLAPQLHDLLDGPLAALRNTHKFELVVRLPLALAAAHSLQRLTQLATARGLHRRVVPLLVACLIVSAATPAILGQLPRREGYVAVPAYWRDAAAWLDRQPGPGSVLVVPASSFADFTWGSTKDEPFQALLKRPMAVRDAVPLGSAGATRWLDEIERRLGSGVGDATLRQALTRAGVRYVVIRNDLRYDAQATPLLAVHESLADAGIDRVAQFGPVTGSTIEQPDATLDGHTRLPYPSVEIYDAGETSSGVLLPRSRLVEVQGAPEDVPAALTALGGDRSAVTSPDAAGKLSDLPLIQTDGVQRREVSFGRPANNYSPVLTASDPGTQGRRALGYAVDGKETTRAWNGDLVDVRASSSAADAAASLHTGAGNGPFAAVDGDPSTRWISGRFGRASGEWLELTFAAPRPIDGLSVQFSLVAPTTEPVRTLRVETDAGALTSVVAGTGDPQHLPAPPGLTQRLRLSIATTDGKDPNGVSIAEVTLPGMTAASRLVVPAPDRQPSALVFTNQQIGRSACLHVGTRPLCSESQAADSEEPTGLQRSVDVPHSATYQLFGTALPKDGDGLERLLVVPGSITATASSRAVAAPEGRPGAAVDRDLGTGWVAAPDDTAPRLTLRLPARRSVTALQFLTDPYLTASRPTEVELSFDGGPPTRAAVDPEGYVRFAARTARAVEVKFTRAKPLLDFDSATGIARTAPVGVAEVRLVGADDLRKALDPNGRSGAVCGYGPRVRVDGVSVDTQVKATVRDLLQRRPVPFTACGKDSGVLLRAGRRTVDFLAGGGFVPVRAKLTVRALTSGYAPPERSIDVVRSSPAELSTEVPARDEQSVLAVAQNYNAGWEAYDESGHKLMPIRVGGWQQGWILPAGAEQVVTARFGPDRGYRTGLLVGLLACLLVLGVGLLSRRAGPEPPSGRRRPRAWVVVGIGLVAGTFMSGWVGVAAVAAAAVCSQVVPRRIAFGLVATAVGAGTLVAAAQPWPGGHAGVTSVVVQASVLFGCALVLLVGETSYDLSRLPRRMMGRSIP